jgi:hypothetical protein
MHCEALVWGGSDVHIIIHSISKVCQAIEDFLWAVLEGKKSQVSEKQLWAVFFHLAMARLKSLQAGSAFSPSLAM